ncbi:T9SS type A sorting domain-containing protein [Carboxylicivirga sp. N1Y90]|uniref:T9SS type A sorting domain-containing protein n=1 Tax=Carboxylicivirga fragile TaxID=3417571 RepID=UPI003D357402|nr:T9SS type A sorting domain-containing protein [Marinilabiliaceae bacterium N1Y90]
MRNVQLFNSVGSLSKSQDNSHKEEKIHMDVAGLSSGIYFMKITTATNRTITRKLVIK